MLSKSADMWLCRMRGRVTKVPPGDFWSTAWHAVEDLLLESGAVCRMASSLTL